MNTQQLELLQNKLAKALTDNQQLLKSAKKIRLQQAAIDRERALHAAGKYLALTVERGNGELFMFARREATGEDSFTFPFVRPEAAQVFNDVCADFLTKLQALQDGDRAEINAQQEAKLKEIQSISTDINAIITGTYVEE